MRRFHNINGHSSVFRIKVKGNYFKHSISTTFVQQFEAVLKKNGVCTASSTKVAGISESVLKHAESRITPTQFSVFIREMVYLTNDEFLACGVSPVPLGHFRKMAKQALELPNLYVVYMHMCNYYNSTLDWLKVNIQMHADCAEIQFKWLKKNSANEMRMLKEVTAISWHRFPSWLVGKNIGLKRLDLDFPAPKHQKEYSLMYPCEVTFDNSLLLMKIDKDYLKLPVVQNEKNLQTYLNQVPLNWFSKQTFIPSINKKVISFIETTEELGSMSIENVADQLNMCSRTLRRKLDANGTSFQVIKDDIRRDISINMLLEQKSLAEIAYYIGFSDISAFSRAFKKWTGVSPSAYVK